MQNEVITVEQEKILKGRVNKLINDNYHGKDLIKIENYRELIVRFIIKNFNVNIINGNVISNIIDIYYKYLMTNNIDFNDLMYLQKNMNNFNNSFSLIIKVIYEETRNKLMHYSLVNTGSCKTVDLMEYAKTLVNSKNIKIAMAASKYVAIEQLLNGYLKTITTEEELQLVRRNLQFIQK